jgi:hypothetical protein
MWLQNILCVIIQISLKLEHLYMYLACNCFKRILVSFLCLVKVTIFSLPRYIAVGNGCKALTCVINSLMKYILYTKKVREARYGFSISYLLPVVLLFKMSETRNMKFACQERFLLHFCHKFVGLFY